MSSQFHSKKKKKQITEDGVKWRVNTQKQDEDLHNLHIKAGVYCI